MNVVSQYAAVMGRPAANRDGKVAALVIDPDNLALVDQIKNAARKNGRKASQQGIVNAILRAALTNPKVAELIGGELAK